MLWIQYSLRRVNRSSTTIFLPQIGRRRQYASRIAIPFQPPPFPVIETCPSPTCQCRETPSGLDIDRELPLNGSIATYAEQILISTGQNDWKSKIEDEESGTFLRQVKSLIGRGGTYSDVRRWSADSRQLYKLITPVAIS